MTAIAIGLDRNGSAAILRIEGDITSGSEGDLTAAYNQAIDGGASAVILDFSRQLAAVEVRCLEVLDVDVGKLALEELVQTYFFCFASN